VAGGCLFHRGGGDIKFYDVDVGGMFGEKRLDGWNAHEIGCRHLLRHKPIAQITECANPGTGAFVATFANRSRMIVVVRKPVLPWLSGQSRYSGEGILLPE
jgi:hypothetical protein